MNLLMECDQGYVEQVVVFMESFYNHHLGESVNLVIASRAWEEEKKEIVEKYILDHSGKAMFLDVSEDLDYFDYKNKSVSIMLSVFAVADKVEYDRIIYADVDMVVNGSIKPVWETDIDGYYMASTLDFNINLARAAIGLGEKDLYFNTGIALLNLDLLRQNGFREMVKELIDNYDIRKYKDNIYAVTKDKVKTWEIIYGYANTIFLHDQGVWATLCRGRMKLIEPKYNVFYPVQTSPIEVLENEWRGFWNRDEIEEAQKNPVVIHYAGGASCKPWYKECRHPSKDLYYKYKDRTIFKDSELLSKSERPDKKGKKYYLNKLPAFLQVGAYYLGYKYKRITGK